MQRWLSRSRVSQLIDALLPVLAVLAALLIGAIMLLVLGANPVKVYGVSTTHLTIESIRHTMIRKVTRWPDHQITWLLCQ